MRSEDIERAEQGAAADRAAILFLRVILSGLAARLLSWVFGEGSAGLCGIGRLVRAMSNTTWVCFECREAVRRPGSTHTAVLCPKCGQPCRNVGHRIRLPSKRAAKAWETLRASWQEQSIAEAECLHRYRVRQIHRIEQEIARLQTMPANEGRQKRIGLLRKRLVGG